MADLMRKTNKVQNEAAEPVQSTDDMHAIEFTVDSALLRELGERLVGKPHIALAELVKNSYDADAHKVTLRFASNQIQVVDNGHGMSFSEFKRFWMRIGSAHKEAQRLSRELRRPMTGSKGVGRLAVQFLARTIELRTVSKKNTKSELNAIVNWDQAVRMGDLTRAVALYKETSRQTVFPDDSRHGTSIILTGLNQPWSTDDFKELAKEVWSLQPPFTSNPELTSEQQRAFEVVLESPESAAEREFEAQMGAVLRLWDARVVGKLLHKSGKPDSNGSQSKVKLSLEFSDGTKIPYDYAIPNCKLYGAQFEIRVFKLEGKMKYGISVKEARAYFGQYGGVHVYDGGFHLPYYGPLQDWLDIEYDSAHRRSKSYLLPEELNVPRGLNYLPTQGRLFGIVHVDTSRELAMWKERHIGTEKDYLRIQVTRDRLADNQAYRNLRTVVRTALDFYAVQTAIREAQRKEAKRPVEPVRIKFQRVDQALAQYRTEMPPHVFEDLRENVEEAIEASEAESEAVIGQLGLLGSLATAGISALAYEHEMQKQFHLLKEIARKLQSMEPPERPSQLRLLANELTDWIERAQAARRLFSYLLDSDNREIKARFKVVRVVKEVENQMGVLLRGIKITTTGLDESLRLPEARFAEWSAIFQNLFLNAVNAMLDSSKRRIAVSSYTRGRQSGLVVQDTGIGVDLDNAEELFKPFVRRMKISPERRALGLGGSGLGLSIVRMIARNTQCQVSFVEASEGFSTAIQISWSEGR
jgi:signal transduction histidine kinase